MERLSDAPITAVSLSSHKEFSMSRLTVGKAGKQMQIIIGFNTAIDRWRPKIFKPFLVIFIALASAHSSSSQLLPPGRVTHEHKCEYFEHVASADTGIDNGEYLESDTARDRYGISTVSKKSLQAMGYTITKDLPMILSGEQLLATGEKESFMFKANHSVSFKRGSGSSAEIVSYTCSDTEVTYIAKNSKAFITPIVIEGLVGGKIVPIDFAVEEGLEFKFTLTCYDDWNEVLIDQSKVRGLSTWAYSSNKDRTAITATYNAIKLDDRHEALTNQFKLNEDLIDYCDIKEIQQRPMKSEVNIPSSTLIESKDLDFDITQQQPIENTPIEGWALRLAAFGIKRNADRLKQKLLKQGWKVYLKHDENLYKIYVGPAKNRADAENLQKKLRRQLDIDATVIYFESMVANEGTSTYSPDSLDITSAVRYIIDEIGNKWVPPAIARNGMIVELIIYLVPTGEVVNVEVSYRDASATDSFVASVVKAVKKVRRFDKLSQLDSGLFDVHFRKFTVRFKPEDLRL